jgi:hypothetical protein
VKATNIFMGDLQASLVLMLGEKGCDQHLLQSTDGYPVDQMSFMFSTSEQAILRQYECAAEPVLMLSKFFQMDAPSAHLVLVHLRARIAQLREKKFSMYADVSHSEEEVLTNRTKTETVLSDDVVQRDGHGRVEPMHRCIATFRSVFADDMERRAGLVDVDREHEHIRIPKAELPTDMAIACLLHPLVGGKKLLAFVPSYTSCSWRN